uniref:Uncharacterized protein n=1 Tax=Salvator merianae TaxID=96440 RepID=A0A8D0AZX8_SALMN
MSESSAKSSQPLASKQDKDVSGKRGRGRPKKQPQEPSEAPTPKKPRGRPKGSKNRTTSKGRVGILDRHPYQAVLEVRKSKHSTCQAQISFLKAQLGLVNADSAAI